MSAIDPMKELECPHCLTRELPALAEHPEGIAECRACGGLFAPLPGGAAVLLPEDVTVHRDAESFEVRIANTFSTFGFADRTLHFRLERDRFVWSRPALVLGVKFDETTNALPRANVARFDWRGFEENVGMKSHEMWSDLVVVLADGTDVRAGFTFPPLWKTGSAITTLLQWAHEEILQPSGGAYRAPERRRRAAPMIWRSGRVERLDAPAP